MVVRPSALQRGGDKNAPQAPLERICAQYGRCFASFVSSTASDKRGFVKGEPPPCPCFASFCRSKRKASAASGTYQAFYKAPRRRQATANYPPPGRRTGYVMPLQKAPPTSLQRKFFLPPKKESSRLPPTAHFFTYYSIPVSCLVIRSQPM